MTTLRRMLTLQRSGTTAGARTAPPAIQHPASSNQHRGSARRGVTLIELLITMTIMAIIAAAILGTAAAAIEGAREKKTQSLITKLHTLLMERYASYETRRIDIKQPLLDKINTQYADPSKSRERGHALADLRLLAVRELMKYEMPDRWTDVVNGPLNSSNPRGTLQANPTVLAGSPPLSKTYHRRLQNLNPNATFDDITRHQGAECLYLAVMNATGDGEARTLFSKQDIGDIDGDGAYEFHDGWGYPISWVRWPTGYAPSPLMSGDAESDHDPLDAFRRDAPNSVRQDPGYGGLVSQTLSHMWNRTTGAFRIVPLIFSAGPDGEQATVVKSDDFVADLDPFTSKEPGQDSDSIDVLPGMTDVNATGHKDNITNHLLEY